MVEPKRRLYKANNWMSKQEVADILGEPSNKGIGAKNGSPKWLYNIGASDNYSFEQPSRNEKMFGVIDLEGLENEEVDMILFITWDNSTVSSINNTYRNKKGELTSYCLFEDGTP